MKCDAVEVSGAAGGSQRVVGAYGASGARVLFHAGIANWISTNPDVPGARRDARLHRLRVVPG